MQLLNRSGLILEEKRNISEIMLLPLIATTLLKKLPFFIYQLFLFSISDLQTANEAPTKISWTNDLIQHQVKMSDREFRDMQRSLTRSPRKPKDVENKPRINNGSYQPHSFAMQWNYEESTENAASSASSSTVKKQILPSDRENLLSHPIYREISLMNGRINR